MERLLAELDSIRNPKEKGDAFERVVKWVLQTAPPYKDQIRRTFLWAEFPRAWGPDTGIDLIGQPVEGGLWAVQAKAYADGASLNWRDISTFVGASAARPEVGFLLLVTTGSSISRNALRNLKASGKPFGVLTRDNLLELDLPRDLELRDLRPRQLQRFNPRPHQGEAVIATVKGFQTHTRGQLIEACGTGKTLTALWVHEALSSARTVVFVPSLALLAQTLREWTSHAKQPFVALAVCSDATATDLDPMYGSVSEIGFPSTTDPEALRAGLSAHDSVVVFATYQSSRVIEDAIRGTEYHFDLLIADEAHRATGRGVSDFTRPLSDEHIPADRRLFMTATPRVYAPQAKRDVDDDDLLLSSMDDAAIYGPRFHTLSFSEAIERGLLTDYRVAIVGVDDEEVSHLSRSRAFVTLGGTEIMDASELAAHIAVAKAMRRFGTRRMFSFHSRISRARRFGEQLPKVIEWLGEERRPQGDVWAESVTGSMAIRERRKILKRLEAVGSDEFGVVSNARCLGEGVDVPLIDGIAFVDPKKSQVDIIQAVGRAIRKAETKAGVSTVVLPVLVPVSEDPETTLERSEFSTVWRVLDALRSHDDVLAEVLDRLRRARGRGEAPPAEPPDKIFYVDVEPKFADALSLRLVEKTTSSWEYGLGVLQRFVAREGHARVHLDHTEGEFRLGGWVNHQRVDYRNGLLGSHRVKALDSVPGWIWNPLEDDFQEGLSRLLTFQARKGHARVNLEHVEDGFMLGGWVHRRRQDYRVGRLAPDRVRALEEVAGWAWYPKRQTFERGLESLNRFRLREGHSQVPQRHVEPDGFKLGTWINTCRTRYMKGKLSSQEKADLEEILGWSWDPREDRFREGLERLRNFQAREGHAFVPARHVEPDGYALGNWVSTKRLWGRKGRLPTEYIEALEAVPGWSWNPGDDAFEEGLKRLMAFYTREGHAMVPYSYAEADGFRLGSWVYTRKADYRSGSLSAERIAVLEAIEGWEW